MAFSDWSSTAASNATVLGVNIGEGCPPGNVNDAIRKAMADLRTAIHPVLATFLASSSLSSARTALGVPSSSTSLTNFGALTNAANKIPYMTGSDAWSTTDLTSFARTLLDDGDAATACATLGAVTSPASSFANPGYVKLTISGSTFIVQWGSRTFTQGSNSVTYPTAFSSFSIAVCSAPGDQSPTGQDNGAAVTATSTTGFTAYQVNSTSVTGFWIAVGV